MASDLKSEVRDFWNRNVNQFNQLERADVGTKEFYQAALDLRYEYHYHLLPLFDPLAQQYPQGHLLEVGCSMGNAPYYLSIDYLFGYGWGGVNRWIPSVVHRALGRVVGWHLMIEATK